MAELQTNPETGERVYPHTERDGTPLLADGTADVKRAADGRPLSPENFNFGLQGHSFKIEFEYALNAYVYQWVSGSWECVGSVDIVDQDIPQAIRDCMGHAFDKLAYEYREALRDGEGAVWADWIGASEG